MGKGFNILLLLLLIMGFTTYYNYPYPSANNNNNSNSTGRISDSCMMVYDEGGVVDVLRSPECGNLIKYLYSTNLLSNTTSNSCQFSTLQGRRNHQEDRVSCNLELNMSFLGDEREKDGARVSVVAVFDGHIGDQASEMASKIFLDYFVVHAVLGSYELGEKRMKGRDVRLGVLKEALVRAIRDIDQTFSLEAVKRRMYAGSTAVVAVLADGHVLVANVGDSKALMCTEKTTGHSFTAKELTRDHNANDPDERRRIEANGGRFLDHPSVDVPLLNGHFPMTRAIGDVFLKRYGIISEPEVTEWVQVSETDAFLIVSSDGVFESLSPQDVCDLLRREKSKHSSSCSSTKLADCIVHEAFEKGSPDNLSVILVPLRPVGYTEEPVDLRVEL